MINRTYRDTLFRLIFGKEDHKEWLLSLYNVLNQSDYDNPDELEITTLNDVIYIGMKNDVSFIIHDHMVLLEHQSTFSKNIPIRFLLYYSKLLEGYLKQNEIILYRPTRSMLPSPRFIVFYNGSDQIDSYTIEKLSSHFSDSPKAEIIVEIFNLNQGNNEMMKEGCEVLKEYCWFIDEINKYRDTIGLDKAVEEVYKNLPKEFIIYNLLMKHRAEVKGMILEEFSQETFEKVCYEDGYIDGRIDGRIDTQKETALKMKDKGLEKEIIIEITGLSEEEIQKLFNDSSK